jgi:hypothetical protein
MELIAEPESGVEGLFVSDDGKARVVGEDMGPVNPEERGALVFFFAFGVEAFLVATFFAGAFLVRALAAPAFFAPAFLAVFLALVTVFFTAFRGEVLRTTFFTALAAFLTVFLAAVFLCTRTFFATFLVAPDRRRAGAFLAAGFLLGLRFIIAVDSAVVITRR